MKGYLYEQSTGSLFEVVRGDLVLLAVGYSGKGKHRDQPTSQHLVGEGPVPRGLWHMGAAVDHARLGPIAIPLAPLASEEPHRSGFFIHGDNDRGDKSASRGCPIFGRNVRTALARAGDATLTVVRGPTGAGKGV